MSSSTLPPPPLPVGPDGLPLADWYRPHGEMAGAPEGGPLVDAVLREATCVACGAQPALRLKVRRVTSFVIWFRWRTERHTLCRSCGLAMTRRAQNRTALTGWWGPFAFIATALALVLNAVALLRLGRLREPQGAIRPSASPGRPTLLRSGALISALVLAGVGYGAATFEVPRWEVGSCVALDGDVARLIPCRAGHDATIVAVVPAPGGTCPSSADEIALIASRRDVACISTTA